MYPVFRLIFLTFLFLSSFAFAQIRFDADFESGNINTVSTTDSINWTVTTRQDIGGRWFYFRMIGIQNRFLKVRVSNSDVKRAMYSYDNQNWQRFSAEESPGSSSFQKTYTQDTVFVAYYTPYTLTHLQQRITDWTAHPFVTLDTLGYTLRNLPLYDLVVTDPIVSDTLKQHIWIHARTHPGESPTSFHFEGIMKTLLGEDEVIKYYLKNLVFHCIPFTNPDGVYYGRSRTNFDGVDVESDWNRVDSLTSIEVRILKQHMQSINQVNTLKVFLNLHSQASPFCTFWIHTASSTSFGFFRREMQFSNLNISDNPFFAYNDYSFSNLSMTFPEGWQWRNWGEKTMALTYETPYDYYSTGAIVDRENLEYLGERTIYALAEYLELSHPKRMILDNNNISSFWTTDTTGTDFFGNNYLYAPAGSHPGVLEYSTGTIESGLYDVHGWWPTNTGFAGNAKFIINGGGTTIEKIVDQRFGNGTWIPLGSLSLQNNGNITITVSDTGNGMIAADAFRVVYKGLPVAIKENLSPLSFSLEQNYPNPFNSQTTIRYTLREPAVVKLAIYNALGQLVALPVNEEKLNGIFEVSFNGNGFSSGVYYMRLSVNNRHITKPMVLLK